MSKPMWEIKLTNISMFRCTACNCLIPRYGYGGGAFGRPFMIQHSLNLICSCLRFVLIGVYWCAHSRTHVGNKWVNFVIVRDAVCKIQRYKLWACLWYSWTAKHEPAFSESHVIVLAFYLLFNLLVLQLRTPMWEINCTNCLIFRCIVCNFQISKCGHVGDGFGLQIKNQR